MDNLRKEKLNYKILEEEIEVFKGSSSIYVTDKEDYKYFSSKEEDISTLGRKLLQHMVINRDPRAEELTRLGFEVTDKILKSLLIISTREDISLEPDVEIILDKSLETKFYFRRMLSNQGIELQDKSKKLVIPKTEKEIEDLVKENKIFKNKIDAIQAYENKLKIREETFRKVLERNLLNKETESIKYKTSLELSKNEIRYPEGFDLSKELDITMYETERLEINNMEISVPKMFKDELKSILTSNPAVALEFMATRLPHLLPLIYKEYKLMVKKERED